MTLPSPEELVAAFQSEFGLAPVVGLEIEWYIRRKGQKTVPFDAPADPNIYRHAIQEALVAEEVPVASVDIERGPFQFEVGLMPTRDVRTLLEDTQRLYRCVATASDEMGLVADFTAKPYVGTYGSGLHIHLHLEDGEQQNVYWKDGEELSPELRDSIAGLLETMIPAMEVFAPKDDSYARFEPNWQAPVSVCWGGNNRTTAIRLPGNLGVAAGDIEIAAHAPMRFRRIEHRVAGADANPEHVVAAVLQGALFGMRDHPELPAPIFGDAGDEKYKALATAFPLSESMVQALLKN